MLYLKFDEMYLSHAALNLYTPYPLYYDPLR